MFVVVIDLLSDTTQVSALEGRLLEEGLEGARSSGISGGNSL